MNLDPVAALITRLAHLLWLRRQSDPATPASLAETVTVMNNHAAWLPHPASPDENELRTAAYYLAEADGFKQHPDVYWTQAIEKLA